MLGYEVPVFCIKEIFTSAGKYVCKTVLFSYTKKLLCALFFCRCYANVITFYFKIKFK